MRLFPLVYFGGSGGARSPGCRTQGLRFFDSHIDLYSIRSVLSASRSTSCFVRLVFSATFASATTCQSSRYSAT